MAMAMAESRATVFCARATDLYPHTVLRKSEAAPRYAPVSSRCGGGAAHRNHEELSPSGPERAQASNHTRRVRAPCLWAPGRSSTPWVPHGRARWPGSPLVTQLCVGHIFSFRVVWAA